MLLALKLGLKPLGCSTHGLAVSLNLQLRDLHVTQLLLKLLICLSESPDLASGIGFVTKGSFKVSFEVPDPFLHVGLLLIGRVGVSRDLLNVVLRHLYVALKVSTPALICVALFLQLCDFFFQGTILTLLLLKSLLLGLHLSHQLF